MDDVVSKIGTCDFIFISKHDEVLQELSNRGITFVVIAPDNAEWSSKSERQLIKQQWFGRFILRDNSHIKDFNSWLKSMKDNYDKWTSHEHLTKYKPALLLLLGEGEYISDIIEDLYQKKEYYSDTFLYN